MESCYQLVMSVYLVSILYPSQPLNNLNEVLILIPAGIVPMGTTRPLLQTLLTE